MCNLLIRKRATILTEWSRVEVDYYNFNASKYPNIKYDNIIDKLNQHIICIDWNIKLKNSAKETSPIK